jgi:hypothetical protein
MRAIDLAEAIPTALPADELAAAVQRVVEAAAPALIVLSPGGAPQAVLPASQLLRCLLPAYVLEDAGLSRALREQPAEDVIRRQAQGPVSEVLQTGEQAAELPVVDPDATVLEVAALMARLRSPVAAVVVDGELVGAVRATRLMAALLSEGGAP